MRLKDDFLLSVVATSRNDNHGKNLLYRMQTFVDGFVEQCKRHNLKAELILVEWNPPDDTLSLAEALNFPKDKGPCRVRIIRVPKEVHMQLDHADKIPLFQMIAKNVGIRRAAGKFVLATNIDIIFSDALIHYIKTKLKPGRLYRTDRLDVPEKIPESSSYDDILQFCAHNVLRINAKSGTILKNEKDHREKFFIMVLSFLKQIKRIKQRITKFFRQHPKKYFMRLVYFSIGILAFLNTILRKKIKQILCTLHPKNTLILHTNACGDFTLLSNKDWALLKGYPEWNKFSWHLDSILLYQAKQQGIKEVDLPRKMPIYHIEHEAGSGYSPEGAHLLFERLHAKGIPYLNDSALKKLVLQMNRSEKKATFNNEDWGMSRLSLEELVV